MTGHQMPTWQLALIIWLVTGVTVVGMGVIVIVSVPAFYDDAMKLIPLAAGVGFLLAFLASLVIAKRIQQSRA